MIRAAGWFLLTRAVLCCAVLVPWPPECRAYEFPSAADPGVSVVARPPWRPTPETPTPGDLGRLWQVSPNAPFLDAFARWDASFYFHIAAFGYRSEGEPEVPVRCGFLPGYAYAVGGATRALNALLGGGFALPADPARFWIALAAAVLVSNAGLFAAMLLLRRFGTALSGDAGVGDRAALLLCAAPTSFFLSAALSEGLFLFLSTASLWCAFRRRVFAAALCAGAAAFVRPPGLFLALPLLAAVCERRTSFRQVVLDALKLLLVPAGFVAAASFAARATGRWNAYFLAQADFGHERFPTLDGVRTLFAFADKTPEARVRDALQIAALAAACASAFLLWRAPATRPFRGALVLWLVVGAVFPVLSDDLISMPRYAAALFPLYLGFATLPRSTAAPVVALGVVAQAAGFLAFSRSWPILI